jgi:hypothetical protein
MARNVEVKARIDSVESLLPRAARWPNRSARLARPSIC